MQFVMATNNLKKRDEMERILKELGIEVLTAKQAGADLGDVEETGTTFEENAYIKAKAALDLTGKASIADDSGLMVDALNVENVPEEKRTARFVSAICCLFPNGKELMVRGECPGKIAYAPAGEGGFGYDPVFVVEGGKTFAELTAEEKDAVSHRGAALRKLKAALRETLEGAKEC